MKKYWLWFIVPFIIIGFYLLYLDNFPIEIDFDKAGKFGDSFGVLNSLFSGLAFIALVITIYLQQQDIRDTKKETQKQNFENTFFKMIDLFNSVVKDLYFKSEEKIEYINDIEEIRYFIKIGNAKIDSDDIIYKGKEVIMKLLKVFKKYKDEVLPKNKSNITVKKGIYEDFHTAFENNIGHYFGTIYQILDFIEKSDVVKKEFYSNLFRAQFSKNELELLFYHSTSEISKRKFTPLLIKYEFFEHLNIEVLDERAIKLIIEKTKELNNNYPLNKIFGENEKSKEKINELKC